MARVITVDRADYLPLVIAGAKVDGGGFAIPGDEVRPACDGEPTYDGEYYSCDEGLVRSPFDARRHRCYECYGIGYRACQDFRAWFMAIREVKFWASVYHNEKAGVTAHVWHRNDPGQYISRDEDILDAMLESLRRHLVDLGAVFPEYNVFEDEAEEGDSL